MAERNSQAKRAILLCGGLCVLFAAIAWMAVRGKSATWDEPGHTATGWMMLWRHDYRLSPDVPPVWEDWISLANPSDALHFDAGSAKYQNLRSKPELFRWCVRVLYQTAGNDGIAMVRNARAMSLILGVGLAVVIAFWAWELAGVVGAVAATFLYCLDPNFLGHAPLVKNDVAFALVYLAAAYALWRVGRRLTWMNAISLALLTALAIGVKLTGVLLGPVLVVGFVFKALVAEPWVVLGRTIVHRVSKLLVGVIVCVGIAIVTYVGLWAGYGFRYESGPNGMGVSPYYYVEVLRHITVMMQHNGRDSAADLQAWQEPLSTQAVVYLSDHRLLPEAWVNGFILTQAGDQGRSAYLCGDTYNGGKLIYFPLAMLFKTPLATLCAAIGAAGLALVKGRFRSVTSRWTTIALAVPALVYAVAIFTAPLNIGLRHAFPIYPFAFIAIGIAAKWAWEAGSPAPGQASGGRIVVMILAALLFAETAAAYPNYIAFFNTAFASRRLSLLSDSNLDWGQDLPLLAAWQRAHPDTTLYLEYFGLCDPAAYGIKYINVPGGYAYGPPPVWPSAPGVVAISATNLQQVYNRRDCSVLFQDRKPDQILGQTIYLFKFDPADFVPKLK